MALDLSAYSAMLKEYYSQQVIENLVYKDNPLLAMLKKRTDMYGESGYPVPIITGAAQGVSADFSVANASANQSNVATQKFAVPRYAKFKIAAVDNQLIDATSNDKGAFLRAMKVQIDGAFRAVQLQLATELYGDGSGIIGTLDGTPSTGVCTLSTASDATRFEVGMTLYAYETGTTTQRAGTGWVIAVNRSAGTITVSATSLTGAAGTPGEWVNTDDLVVAGNRDNVIQGLQAWLTDSNLGTAFNGVTRSSHATRLAGVVDDLSSLPIQESFNVGAILVNEEGGAPDHAFCNYSTYAALTNAMAGKIVYDPQKGPANITFPAIQLPTPKGMVKVIPDRSCPANTVFMLSMDNWCLHTLGDCPKYLDNDNLTLLRDDNSNSVKIRIGYYGNLWTNAPGWSGRFTVGA